MRKFAFAIALLLLTGCRTFAQSPRIQTPLTATTCPGVGCTTLSVSGLGAASVQVTGTFVGTLQFETSLDGVTYATWSVTPSGGGMAVTSATATGIWQGAVGGLAILRTRFSAYTSGTATVTMQASDNGFGLAAGLDTEIQFNDSGNLGNSSLFTWDPAADDGVFHVGVADAALPARVQGFWGDAEQSIFSTRADSTGLVVVYAPSAGTGQGAIGAVAFGPSAVGVNVDAIGTDNAIIRGIASGVGVDGAAVTAGIAAGIEIVNATVTNGATLDTAYGLLIDNQTRGSTNYALKTGTGLVSFGDVVQATGYKSSDGTAGATVTLCTGFKNGLCISGT